MAKLGSEGGGASVLDPACGVGLLLSLATEELSATVVHGVDVNSQVADMAQLLLPSTAQVFHGNCLRESLPLQKCYDLIISEPPFAFRLSKPFAAPGSGEIFNDTSDALLAWSSSKLSPAGRAVFLLSASCIGPRGEKLWKSLGVVGLNLRALIHVPSGHLKATAIESYIAIADRSHHKTIFTAQYGSDEALQRQILTNYQSHQPGKRPAQGRLMSLPDFRGFKILEAEERLHETAKRKGLKSVPMRQLILEHQVLKASEAAVVDGANDLYLPLTGFGNTVLHPDSLTAKSSKVVRLVVNGELADARFLAAALNDDLGRLFLDTVTLSSAVVRQINLEMLLGADFYLPAIELQKQASRCHLTRQRLACRAG